MERELYCPECGDDRKVNLIERRETYPVRGEPITVDAEVAVCSICGSGVSDLDIDQNNMLKVFDSHRIKHGLLTAGQIVGLRERYGLSQRSLAGLLGWGVVTIQRYESGSLQDKAHDAVLRTLADPNTVLEFLSRPLIVRAEYPPSLWPAFVISQRSIPIIRNL